MRKGFTLIELLAVIVILAIIALIATPIVLDIIEDSKKSSTLRSSEMYLEAVELSIANAILDNKKVTDGTYNILDTGDVCLEYDSENRCNNILEVEINGETPTSGSITIGNGEIVNISIVLNNKTIVKNNEGSFVEAKLVNKIISDSKDKGYLKTKQDDYGTSYYFSGDVTNNYVQFGEYQKEFAEYIVYYDYDYSYEDSFYDSYEACVEGAQYLNEINMSSSYVCRAKVHAEKGDPMYWRILRINGDGTIRLVYDGPEKVENGVSHITSIDDSVYNEGGYNDAKYVGYTYDASGTDDTQISSSIKKVVDSWYEEYLKTNYEYYIADSIFCNDRSVTSYTYYDSNLSITDDPSLAIRTGINYTSSSSSLICANQEDRYTVDDVINGNGFLSNPVGLFTYAEVKLAGSYLNSGENLWTLTPIQFDGSDGSVIVLLNNFSYSVEYPYGVRPVINLKADVEFTGSGTIDDPYIIVTE